MRSLILMLTSLTGMIRRIVDAARDLGHEVLLLLIPPQCAGCQQWDTPLCESCTLALSGPLIQVTGAGAVGELPVWSLSWYTGPVRSIVLAWKNARREDLAAPIDSLCFSGARRLVTHFDSDTTQQLTASQGLLILPAPSGMLRRLRGRLVAARIADSCARGLSAEFSQSATNVTRDGPDIIASADVLRRQHPHPLHWFTSAHQAGKSAKGRRANRAAPPRVMADIGGWCVLLVDDVITTGATLASCAQALSAAGAIPIGALTLAATPPPQQSDPLEELRRTRAQDSPTNSPPSPPGHSTPEC